jgi:hypothetical protein
MFSFFSKKEDFGAQSTHFNNTIVNASRENFNFMKDANRIQAFNSVIDNMVGFLNNKLKFATSIQTRASNNFKLSDIKMPEEDMKFFVSLGMVNIMTTDEIKMKEYLQLLNLQSAEFQQKASVIPGFIQYMNEYIKKLTVLKELSIEKEQLPENTGFQVDLRKKLDYLLQKNKAMIFDVYLNHYIQYMYLLFAINIFKNTEAFFKINAEQQKQIALLTKTDGLVSAIESLTSNDEENMKRINENIQYLIDQTSKVSEFNKIDTKNQSRLKKLGEQTAKLNKQGGGAPVSTPAADGIIDQILTKHKYFYELYTTTRNSMPEYFKNINNMIIEKINKLQEMKSQIVNLTNQDINLLTKTNDAISKFMDASTNKDLQKGYNAQSHPAMESLKQRLNLISNEIESSIKSATQQATQVAKETDKLQKVFSNTMAAPVAQPMVAPAPAPVAQPMAAPAPAPVAQPMAAPDPAPDPAPAPVTPMAAPVAPVAPMATPAPVPGVGGFVRSGTRFPKNNYKTKKFNK